MKNPYKAKVYRGGKDCAPDGVTYYSPVKEFAAEMGEVEEVTVEIKNAYDFNDEGYRNEKGELVLDKNGNEIRIGHLETRYDILHELRERGYDGAIDQGVFIVTF